MRQRLRRSVARSHAGANAAPSASSSCSRRRLAQARARSRAPPDAPTATARAAPMLLADARTRSSRRCSISPRGTLYRAPNPSEAERIAIVAVGGYGRGTLAPGSDIDLLFLLPYKQTGWSESIIEFILYSLWDTRLKVGHATRSVDECIRLAQYRQHHPHRHSRSALHLRRRRRCSTSCRARFRKEIVAGGCQAPSSPASSPSATSAITRAGESRYLVEPDVKDGKGGLRDLHTLFWIAKFHLCRQFARRTRRQGRLHARGTRDLQEDARISCGRCAAICISSRDAATTGLSFDRQPELAERLGYKAHGGLRHVERFMKHYFLIAKDVGDLTRIFCASLEAKEMKDAPALAACFSRFVPRRSRERCRGMPDFRIEGGRLDHCRSRSFDARSGQSHPALRHCRPRRTSRSIPTRLKRCARHLPLIDKELCARSRSQCAVPRHADREPRSRNRSCGG